MKLPQRYRQLITMLPILLLALLLRAWSLGWGLPSVYEEAFPLKVAWTMWHFGSPQAVDLNPHFFNYPSLTIYLHFITQGLLFLAMKLGGLIDTGVAFSARYLTDPTPLYLTGRTVSLLFGVGTVWLTWSVGRVAVSRLSPLIAAALLAVNTYHISRCNLIEVDVPLTFFVMLGLGFSLRLLGRADIRNCILTGLAIGLAVSTKYTGAILLLPAGAAFAYAFRRPARPRYWYPLLTLLVAGAVFLMTSPYTLLDAAAFREHLQNERQHMQLGHFGLVSTSSWSYYISILGNKILGWPALILALAGMIISCSGRRRSAFVVLTIFTAPYLIVISSMEMHAERYLLPLIPVLLIFAAAAIGAVRERIGKTRLPHRARIVMVAGLCLLCLWPAATSFPAYVQKVGTDTRNQAAQWITANIEAGSLLVVEQYGPELFSPQVTLKLRPETAQKVLELMEGEPGHHVLKIPMFQVMPARSGVFYDMTLYDDADYIITVGSIRSRYEADPSLFRQQLAFYRELEETCPLAAEFKAGKGGGSTISIYRNPEQPTPFQKRQPSLPPRMVAVANGISTGSEELFYFEYGTIFEFSGSRELAIECYDLALQYPILRPGVFKNIVRRRSHCTLATGRREETLRYLAAVARQAPSPEVRIWIEGLGRQIVALR
ncbi:MAG: phospholipid carrier-dependent glycosyltransferase [bacterium]|nr:phospholipid carrier-dependent glycosyltransferase [bacterium]